MTSKRHGCDCEKCKECCRREAGYFMPEEVAVAAKFLGMGEREFVSKYCCEHIEGGVIVLSPAMRSGGGGCVFLDARGLCRIHPVKPYECRKVYGCGPASRHKRIREIIVKKWA